MTQQHDPKGALRAALFMSELERARDEQPLGAGPASLLLRAALAVVYMYLILISYLIMGTIGPVFVSTLFLVAFFVPFLHQRVRRLRRQRASRTTTTDRSDAQQSTPAQR